MAKKYLKDILIIEIFRIIIKLRIFDSYTFTIFFNNNVRATNLEFFKKFSHHIIDDNFSKIKLFCLNHVF